ncbi:MAG TPA: hypothetical protein VJ696_14095 [Rhodanobacteraceae bacterium]|nr:hypothetical protein [Rhodanobacteraceae bacterium]
MQVAMKKARSFAGVMLLALALPVGANATPYAFPLQYPSATTTNALPPALKPALERAIIQEPDAVWLETPLIAADGQAADLFGFRVLVAGDTAFVSAPAPGPRPGKVYVFSNAGGEWAETQQLTATPSVSPPPNWSDFFGWSLSLSGDTLLVGAPDVFNPMFGPVGGAYVFVLDGGSWVQQQELLGSDAGNFNLVGSAVALSGDTAFVGAPGYSGFEGKVYEYTRSGAVWTEGTPLVASDGVSGDGRQFGSAIKCDGTNLLIGAPGPDDTSADFPPGTAYVFANAGGAWNEVQILRPDDSADGDQFGFSIALDGTAALIGAPAANIGANTHQGAAYAFDGASGTFTQVVKLVAADGVAYDQLGQSIAAQGGMALVGMWSHNDVLGGTQPPPKHGSAYLYSASHGTWNFSTEFTASDGTDGDSFGWDVAIDGTTLMVGAQGTIGANPFQGEAYIFTPGDPPVAEIGPASMTFTLEVGASGSDTLTIGNSGGSDLDYTIAEATMGDGCATTSDVPWLDEASASGTVGAGDSADVTVTVDASALDPGGYPAFLCVATNDPDHALVEVPVSLIVTDSDTIFGDGFDGAP